MLFCKNGSVMGTKTQFFSEYRSGIDSSRNNSNSFMSLYHENQAPNVQNPPGSFASLMHRSSFPGPEFAKMRQTILHHETVFRNQLVELHRLYGRQKELMEGMKRRELDRNASMMMMNGVTELSLGTVRVSPSDTDTLTLDLMPKQVTNSAASIRLYPPIDLSDKRNENGTNQDQFPYKPSAFPQPRLLEPSKEQLHCPLVPSRKRKLFGVEISESNDGSVDTMPPPNMSRSASFKPFSWIPDSSGDKAERTAGSLPWFLRKRQNDGDTASGIRTPYFMNLESLQNCTQSFFKKAETEGVQLKTEIRAEKDPRETDIDLNIRKDLNTDASPKLRPDIDLNLSLEDDELGVRVTVTEIGSEEGPVVNKSAELFDENCDRLAAEAILAISVHGENEPDPSDDEGLKWFAELILSESIKDEERSIPENMDYFEFMTLKLEDCKGKQQSYTSQHPAIFENNHIAEKGHILTKHHRQSRRGKPRRDFQRDILPGLVTLSRLEVSEDLQAFEELMKPCQGKTWKSSSGASKRSSRGRKRCFISSSTPPSKTKGICSSSWSPSQSPRKPQVWQLHERSLTGWGRRTRRLPRQRCPPSNSLVSFPIKC